MNTVEMRVIESRVPAERPNALWLTALRANRAGPIPDEANILLALRMAPELHGLVRFNEFQNRVEFGAIPPWRSGREIKSGDPWTDNDDLDLQSWLQRLDLPVRLRPPIADCVERVARDCTFHLVRDYLNGLSWDGVQRLSWLAIEYFKSGSDCDYLAAVSTRFMISAVARILQPGCQADHALVLEGPQGVGKTSVVRILGSPWITDSIPDLANKDSAIQLQGIWLVELSELAALRRSELETVKGFISRTYDRFRPPYGRRAIELPRQCAFIATTNESQYLRDRTGNRRFWPIRVGLIDLDKLRRDRDQLWAEAVHEYRAGTSWHLAATEIDLATSEQQARVYVTELESSVVEYLDRIRSDGITEVAVKQVMAAALSIDVSVDHDAERRFGPQVAEILSRQGWSRIGAIGRHPSRRTIYRFVGEPR